MKFAPIIPWKYDPASITNYHLILAHQVVADMEYRDYYLKLPEDHTIILDNSVIELGYTDKLMITQALNYMDGFAGELIVVCPDVLRDREATAKAHRDFIVDEAILAAIDDCGHSVMIVPQGVDHIDWRASLHELTEEFGELCTYVGIPRLTEDYEGGRRELFIDSGDLLSSYRVHLLGIQHNIQEVEWALSELCVQGVDSSLPIRAAFFDLPCSEVRDLRKLPDPDIFRGNMMESVRHRVKECCDFVSTMHS